MYTRYFKLFKQFSKRVDGKCAELINRHHAHMQCKLFCSSCCQAFKVLPIEFHYIQENIKKQIVNTNKYPKTGECKFLVDGSCTIYEYRPIICRSHGFPLARYNDEAGAYEISYCHLNFEDYRLEDFKSDNVFYEDDFNVELFELNKKFIQDYGATKYDMIELLEVNNINVNNTNF